MAVKNGDIGCPIPVVAGARAAAARAGVGATTWSACGVSSARLMGMIGSGTAGVPSFLNRRFLISPESQKAAAST
ncbi:hypothetical protein GCM10009101_20580 [Brevundimonas lenta]